MYYLDWSRVFNPLVYRVFTLEAYRGMGGISPGVIPLGRRGGYSFSGVGAFRAAGPRACTLPLTRPFYIYIVPVPVVSILFSSCLHPYCRPCLSSSGSRQTSRQNGGISRHYRDMDVGIRGGGLLKFRGSRHQDFRRKIVKKSRTNFKIPTLHNNRRQGCPDWSRR